GGVSPPPSPPLPDGRGSDPVTQCRGTSFMNTLRWTPVALLAAALVVLPGCGDSTDPDEKRAVDAPSGNGLKYVDLQEGQGEALKAGEVAEVRYTGKLRTGLQEFDSNSGNGKPAFRFVVG